MHTLSNKEIAAFTSQIAIILHSGITPYEGITILLEDDEKSSMHEVLSEIFTHLDDGDSFTESLKKTEAFPSYLIEMVNIGEASGTLENVMSSLSDHYQRLYENAENLRTAISYPLIMIILMMAVVIVLITQVLPIFNRVYEQLGTTLFGPSRVILNIGTGLNQFSFVFVIILVLLLILYFYLTKTAKGQSKLAEFLNKATFSKEISSKLAISRFTSGMAIALSSGLDIDESFRLSKELVNNEELEKKIKEAEEIMAEKDIAEGLVDAKVLTGMNARLIKLGYKTGGMDTILTNISKTYDEEANNAIVHLIGIIEPTLVAVLAIITGIILLSVMLPLLGIMNSL